MSTEGRGFYKGQEITFSLPAGWNLLAMAEPIQVPALKDLGSAVRRGLAQPIGAPSLEELVAKMPNKKVAIISEDQTRPSPTGKVILPLIDELNGLGISDKNIDIIIGRGTHRAMTEEEMKSKLGKYLFERIQVSVHDPDANDLVFKGTTSRGTPCWTNRLVAEAGLKIGVGTSNPHYFAGYGGGPKIVLPGVSGRKTIQKNHVLISDPHAIAGIREGNPVWEDMLEAARIVGLDLKVDIVLNQAGEIYKIFIGDVEQAQDEAIKSLLDIYGVPVPRMADVTITCAYPLETDLIQSGKAILLADSVTRPGGTIILLSACPDGAGPLMYETLKERPESEEIIRWIGEGKASTTGGPMAAHLRALLKAKSLTVITEGLTKKQLEDMEMSYAPSIEEAIAQAREKYPQANVIILPVGGSTFPYLQEEVKAKAA